jgi:hypothetical protein
MKSEKQTAPERELGSGEETEENLPLFPTPAPEPTQEEDWDFDWNNSPSVILREQSATAAYYNPFGALVIRQRDPFGDADPFLVVEPENVAQFLSGLRDRAKRGDE